MNLDNIKAWISDNEMNIQFGETIENIPCFIANWNNFNKLENMFSVMQNRGKKVELLWEDSYRKCCHCEKYTSNIPGYYGDQIKMIWVSEHEEICSECAPEFIDEIIDFFIEDPTKRAIPTWLLEQVKAEGFICLDDEKKCEVFEIGIREGRNDDPEKILRDLKKKGILDKHDLLFAILDIDQFGARYTVLLREKDE